MAWDDAPPDADLVKSTDGWDSQPPDPDLKPVSKLESFARGVENNFPLLNQAIAGGSAAIGDKDYSQNLAEQNAAISKANAANPITYGAGAVTGALAPMAIPGVGEALEASPIAGNAVFGGLNALSNTDIVKNPKEAAKQALIGAGIGAGTAGIIKGLTPETSTLENIANKKAIQSVDVPSGIVGAMAPEERTNLGNFLQENDLVGRDKSEVLERVRGLSDEFGEKIRHIGELTEELHVDPADHYQAVNNLLEKGQQFQGLANREAKGLARDYKAGANDILNLPDNPAWKDIQALKEQYGKLAFDAKGEVKSEGAKDTYFALKDMLTAIADKAQDNPNLGQDYKAALAGYSRLQPIESGLERAVDAEAHEGAGMGVRGLTGLIHKAPGPVRALIGTGALLTGHPFIAGAAALPELTNAALQSKAASAMAPLMPKLRQGLTQEMIDYINSKVNNKMSRGGVVPDDVKKYVGAGR